MLNYIVLALMIWAGWGISMTFLKLFIYFRGPKHMIDCYVSNPVTKKSGLIMKKQCDEAGYPSLVLVVLVFSMLIPPLFLLDFINDIVLFSWLPYRENSKKKTP